MVQRLKSRKKPLLSHRAILRLGKLLFGFFPVFVVLGLVTNADLTAQANLGKISQPYEFQEDADYFGPIRDFAVLDGYLYVLYPGQNMLKCYTTQGEYLRSYHFTEEFKSSCHLLVCDGKAYLRDKGQDLYELREGRIVNYLNWITWEERIEELWDDSCTQRTKEREQDGTRYEQRLLSIWKLSPSGEEVCVLRRPWWTIFAMPQKLGFLAVGYVLSLFGYVILLIRHPGDPKEWEALVAREFEKHRRKS